MLPEEKTRDSAKDLEALFLLARQIIKEERLDQVLDLVVKAALSLLSGDRGLLVLTKDNIPEYKVIRNWNPEEYEGNKEPLSRTILAEVVSRKEPTLIEDASNDLRFSEKRSVKRHFIRSVLAAPLLANGKIEGVLYLESRSMKHFFGPQELSLFTQILELSSQALESFIQRASWEQANPTERLARHHLNNIVSQDKSFLGILETAILAANSLLPVLIQGESGTGKELIAKALHANSPRSNAPFLTINCGAISPNLLESELFGHVKGAFTGATQNKTGLIAAAHTGTLFLDEIGELPKELQVKLLRTLQFGEVLPVGSTSPERFLVRFIAATNRDLEQEVRDGNFRQDFLYRLNAITLQLPPLRDRAIDILPLFHHFLEQAAQQQGRNTPKVDPEVEAMLRAYPWPGNIRELENETLRLVALTPPKEPITKQRLSQRILQTPSTPAAAGQTLQDQEKVLVEHHLKLAGGNRTKAAKNLGISRETLRQMLKRYGIE